MSYVGSVGLLTYAARPVPVESPDLAQRQGALYQVLDDLDVPLALFDEAGGLLHQTPALGRVLAEESVASSLRVMLTSIGFLAARRHSQRALAGHGTPPAMVREVSTISGCYRLRVSYIEDAFPGTDAAVLVLVERVAVQPFSDTALRERYRLTAREIEVARLLERGGTNAEIAETLRISPRTAEHHTENVLMKVGARSRALLGARLRGDAPVGISTQANAAR